MEDQQQRENLKPYLYEMGIGWFKRTYAASTSWQDEVHISLVDEKLSADGIRGPLAKPYRFSIKLDNQTLAEIDIGKDFGGITNATAEISDNSLIMYVLKPGTSDLFFTITDNIHHNTTDILNVEYKHVNSNVAMKSVFKRKQV